MHLKINFQPKRRPERQKRVSEQEWGETPSVQASFETPWEARRIVHLKQKSMLKGEADSFECPEELMSEDEAPAKRVNWVRESSPIRISLSALPTLLQTSRPVSSLSKLPSTSKL